jgi:rod shape determining protein RodA
MGTIARRIDPVITILIILIGSFGLFLLLTISKDLFVSQLIYFGVGLGLMLALAFIDPYLLRWVAPVCYVAIVVLLAVSYLGPSVRGATRWIDLAGIRLQPSELAKPLALLAFSSLMTSMSPRKAKNALIHIGLFAVPFLLVFKQPDLGSSIVYASMWGAMMVASGFRVRYVATLLFIFIVGTPVMWHFLAPYQQSRIITFINPGMDPKGAGYNALQAMIAVGSGQWFGRGLGLGTQSHLRFLPEFHTDFMFATLIEELGFVGGLMLFIGYILLLWRIVAPLIGRAYEDAMLYIYSIGLFSMIMVQVFVNSGMNMGIIPITGITLPLVSYGGSSLLSLSASFGFLWALRRPSQSDRVIAIR